MNNSFINAVGTLLLGLSIAAFGAEQLFFHHPLMAFLPVKISPLIQPYVATVLGIIFILAAVSIWFPYKVPFMKFLPYILFAGFLLLYHLQTLIRDLSNGQEWTVCFELLSLGIGSWLSVSSTTRVSNNNVQIGRISWKVCRILFGLSLLVFCLLHFIFANYISTLVPEWIPFARFWPYFFGGAFLVTSISLLFNCFANVSTLSLAFMFFIWVITLHLPRVIANPVEPELTSLFVALGMGGVSLLFASKCKKSKVTFFSNHNLENSFLK